MFPPSQVALGIPMTAAYGSLRGWIWSGYPVATCDRENGVLNKNLQSKKLETDFNLFKHHVSTQLLVFHRFFQRGKKRAGGTVEWTARQIGLSSCIERPKSENNNYYLLVQFLFRASRIHGAACKSVFLVEPLAGGSVRLSHSHPRIWSRMNRISIDQE